MKQYESHKTKHEARGHLFREEGFKEFNQKYGPDYDSFENMRNPNDEMNEKYNMYRMRFYEGYWDTKENDAFYSLPYGTRLWM